MRVFAQRRRSSSERASARTPSRLKRHLQRGSRPTRGAIGPARACGAIESGPFRQIDQDNHTKLR